jgi:hypothetical protein
MIIQFTKSTSEYCKVCDRNILFYTSIYKFLYFYGITFTINDFNILETKVLSHENVT